MSAPARSLGQRTRAGLARRASYATEFAVAITAIDEHLQTSAPFASPKVRMQSSRTEGPLRLRNGMLLANLNSRGKRIAIMCTRLGCDCRSLAALFTSKLPPIASELYLEITFRFARTGSLLPARPIDLPLQRRSSAFSYMATITPIHRTQRSMERLIWLIPLVFIPAAGVSHYGPARTWSSGDGVQSAHA